MFKHLSDIKTVNGIEVKKCLHPSHEGERYVPLAQMTKRKARPIPYGSNCLRCFNLYNRRERDTEEKRLDYNRKINQYNKDVRAKKGIAWGLWNSARNRARKNKIEFTLRPEDVIVPDKCPVLGLDLIQDPPYLTINNIKGQLFVPNYPSIDRKNPELGYIKENITVISWRANDIKGNSSLHELQSVVDWMQKQ